MNSCRHGQLTCRPRRFTGKDTGDARAATDRQGAASAGGFFVVWGAFLIFLAKPIWRCARGMIRVGRNATSAGDRTRSALPPKELTSATEDSLGF
jgi:hypothetical protein